MRLELCQECGAAGHEPHLVGCSAGSSSRVAELLAVIKAIEEDRSLLRERLEACELEKEAFRIANILDRSKAADALEATGVREGTAWLARDTETGAVVARFKFPTHAQEYVKAHPRFLLKQAKADRPPARSTPCRGSSGGSETAAPEGPPAAAG